LVGRRPKRTDKEIAALDDLISGRPIPEHIAIIMDGNGRWAKSRGRTRVFGHREGVRSVREIVETCGRVGVRYLTLYTFSAENWRRPEDEVSVLMHLLVSSLRTELRNLHRNNVRLRTIGDISKLPTDALREVTQAVEQTADNTGLTLILALSYSARWDIVCAARRVAAEARDGARTIEQIDEQSLATNLSTASFPDPDLLIRTSGEMRLSNFLLWELAYTELYITECFWPDFRTPELFDAIRAYQQRERRFGMVSEQLAVPASADTSLSPPQEAASQSAPVTGSTDARKKLSRHRSTVHDERANALPHLS
jgi:undecaprenyl diphosphate synthase